MYSAYSMSKRAVVAFSDALRQEMHKFDMTVITIEPSLYRTHIAMADPYIDANKKSWSKTPTDIREDYGEEYFDAALTKIRASLEKARPQVDEVIHQMELAVCTRNPRHRYVPNGMTYLRTEILRHLPTTWTDKVFSGMSPSIKPRLAVRQESVKASK
ncbi:hypothetical protein C0Q70_00267 [Pomacea canaliculata]|uniref:Uncharacterized protein n=2 Tax=Pomacea canaliculata TaxID=400727 RepID=A0A2T7PW79_POMCA|nr:hypothetical protein C0Q70_00267 [Pomacea canaliculata]